MDKMLNTLKTLVEVKNNDEDEILAVYLNLARQAVFNKLYPYGNGTENIQQENTS